ncbi:hypothetical protein ACFS27_16375 [Promicromonospora vindobonensis]|uniref:Uncharacterized protein n=1 Tax=Promicromonospora vindobonensis TaxID=195748 RepID=A0ABW5VV49_9MICO
MATEHDPSALDAPIQPGGVPRHASAKERKSRGIKPFLSDLKAEVQNQFSRADAAERPSEAPEHPTQVVYAAPQAPQLTAGPQAPAPPPPVDDGAALASAALAAADHAGAAADAARTEAAAARADAGAARTEAAAARADAVTAQATAGRADARLQAVRAEIEAAHQEFGALRAEVDAVRERARQHVLIAWIGAGVAALLAVAALVLPL